MYNPRVYNDPLNEMYNPLLDQWEPLRRQARNGAKAFFAIAVLSLVNSYFVIKGIRLRFIAGLGITQLIDVIGSILANDIGTRGHLVAIVVNILPAGVFGIFGLFARKYARWSFFIGMVLYAIDGLFLLFLFRDFLGMGFHLVVLYPLYKGWQATRALQRIRHTSPQSSVTEERKDDEQEAVERGNEERIEEDSTT